MTVGQRLFLAVVPAVLGVFTVAALAYWGQYAHTAPEWLVVVAIVAAVGSLIVAWRNTRYVARRIEQLASSAAARPPGGKAPVKDIIAEAVGLRTGSRLQPDELDAIEDVVERLSGAVGVAEASRQAEVDQLRAERREYAQLLSTSAGEASRQLDEIRLPLHILLENRFGDLNENQEEMLGAARQAAEVAGAELERMREIADVDLGTLTLRRDPLKPGDMLGMLVPALKAEGEARDVRVVVDIAPALPAILADRARLQEALSLVLNEALSATPGGGELRVIAALDGKDVRVDAVHGDGTMRLPRTALAARLIRALGGSVDAQAGTTTVRFPRV